MTISNTHTKNQQEADPRPDGDGLSTVLTDQKLLEQNERLKAMRDERASSTSKQGMKSIGLVDSTSEETVSIKALAYGHLRKSEDERRSRRKAYLAQLEEQDKINQAEANRRRIRQLFSECQIGERFQGLSFDDYKPTCEKAKKALGVCIDYAQRFNSETGAGKTGAGLIFLGKPGTGKNHLAAAICTHIINDGHSAVHTTVMKAIRRIKSTWSRGATETEQKAILSFCVPDLLVIDEVGVQFGSDTEMLLLTEIINERYERRKPTILLTNLTAAKLAVSLGDRVIDRFRDGGEMVVFDWESYRGRRA